MFRPTKKSEKRDAETAATLTDLQDSLADARFRRRFFALFASLNLAVWIVGAVFANRLYYLFTEVVGLTDTPGIIAMSLPLGFGFYSAYSLLRQWFPDIEDNKQLDSDMMSTYAYQSDSTKRWYIWVASTGFAAINTIAIVFFVAWLGGE